MRTIEVKLYKYDELSEKAKARALKDWQEDQDEDFLDSLRKDIKAGMTVMDAFKALADVCRRLLESESEAQQSEEYFIDHADANGYEFTEDGKHV